jgi:YVTN family beta-propeller protein
VTDPSCEAPLDLHTDAVDKQTESGGITQGAEDMNLTSSLFASAAAASVLALCAGTVVAQSGPESDPDGNLVPLYQIIGPASDIAFGGPLDDGRLGPLPSRDEMYMDFVFGGSLPEGDTPSGVAYSADASQIIISHRDSMNLIVWDAATQTFVREIALTGSPNDVAVSSDGVHAVTANVFEGTASVVDLLTGVEITSLPLGISAGSVAISPDGATALVSIPQASELAVIDVASATQIGTISDAPITQTLSFATETGAVTLQYSKPVFVDNQTFVLTDYANDALNFYDVSAGLTAAVSVADQPLGVDVSDDGTMAIVAHNSEPEVSIIDVTNQQFDRSIPLGTDGRGRVALNGDATKAAVSISNACVVVDLTDDSVSPNLSTASVSELLTTADGDYAIGVGFYGSMISFASESIVSNLNFYVSTPIGAVAPVGNQVSMISNTFGEDLVVLNTDPAGPGLAAAQLSGPEFEGDKCRTVAVSPDGSTVAAVNIFSDSVTIIDAATSTVLGWAKTGQRPNGVKFSPDGSQIVVANLDSDYCTVIDVDTLTTTEITTQRRNAEVEISPDGQYAYLSQVANGDGVWRINLDTLAVDGSKLTTGNMGSAGYAYWPSSGIALSHDGTVLAVCGSFDDVLTLVDTTTWSKIIDVPVGDFPFRATFSADDSLIYVSNTNDDTVSVVENNGGSSAVIDTISVGDRPYESVVTSDGSTLYILNASDKNVGVVDLVSGVQTDTITLPISAGVGLYLNEDKNELYTATGTSSFTVGPDGAFTEQDGRFVVIDTLTNTIANEFDTDVTASDFICNADATLAAIASPNGDGAVVIRWVADCEGDLNGDGLRDLSDLGILLASYEIDDGGDIDGDGDTDLSDLGALLAVYDVPCP